MNKKEDLLILCPKYAPLRDGLAGHTIGLCSALSEFYNISLLTNESIPPSSDKINIQNKMKYWNFRELKKQFFKSYSRDSHILIQYVPSLYGNYGGINFGLPLFLLYLKFFKKKHINILVHELYYPFEFHWKSIILHIIHRLMLIFVLNSAKTIFYSTSLNKKLGQRHTIFRADHLHLPVGSSVEIQQTHENKTKDISFLLLGGPHPSKRYDLIFETLDEFYNYNETFKLHLVGTNLEELSKKYNLSKKSERYTISHGVISDHEISKLMNQCHYLLAYFVDGLTTRRSSVMSALAHGLSVISSKSKNTEGIMIEAPGVKLLPIDPIKFKTEFISLVNSGAYANQQQVKEYHDDNFSWKKISKIIKNSLSV